MKAAQRVHRSLTGHAVPISDLARAQDWEADEVGGQPFGKPGGTGFSDALEGIRLPREQPVDAAVRCVGSS